MPFTMPFPRNANPLSDRMLGMAEGGVNDDPSWRPQFNPKKYQQPTSPGGMVVRPPEDYPQERLWGSMRDPGTGGGGYKGAEEENDIGNVMNRIARLLMQGGQPIGYTTPMARNTALPNYVDPSGRLQSWRPQYDYKSMLRPFSPDGDLVAPPEQGPADQLLGTSRDPVAPESDIYNRLQRVIQQRRDPQI